MIRKSINNFFDYLQIDQDADFSERLRSEIIITFSILGTLLSCVHQAVVSLILPFSYAHYINNFLWIFTFSIPGLLVYNKKPLTGRYSFAVLGLLGTASNHICFGSGLHLEVVYLLIVFSVHYIFPKGHRTPLIVLTLLIHASITLWQTKYPAPYADLLFWNFHINYYFFSLLLLANVTHKILAEHKAYKNMGLRKQVEANKKKDQIRKFNHVIANDLKEPLRNIVSFSSLLERSNDPKEKAEFIDYIVENGRQLNQTIESIRNFQEANQGNLKIEKVRIEDIIHDVSPDLNCLLEPKELTIVIDQFPHIYSYPYSVNMVLKNLLEHVISRADSSTKIIHVQNKNFTKSQELRILVQLKKDINEEEELDINQFEEDESLNNMLSTEIIVKTLKTTLKGKLQVAKCKKQNIKKYLIHLPQSLNQ